MFMTILRSQRLPFCVGVRSFPFILAVALLSATFADDPTDKERGKVSSSSPSSLFAPANETQITYQVRQIVRLEGITSGSKLAKMWISIPGDEPGQKILDFSVASTPGEWTIVEDAERRGKFLRVDVANPTAESIDVEVAFIVKRNPIYVAIDHQQVGPLSDGLKKMLAENLALDSPHMEVTKAIKEIADQACGSESNIATQAMLLLGYVAKTVDHYSYSSDPDMPSCGIGDNATCMKQGGGCCTDLNSLFISLARARGIPARLQMGYRLQEKNGGKLVDPGYRCWVEYFVPGYGWISADVVEADTPGGLGPERWLSGLTARRLWLNTGREFQLAEVQSVDRVNHMSIAYAEIDGKPARLIPEGTDKPQITRKVLFTELASPTPDSGTR